MIDTNITMEAAVAVGRIAEAHKDDSASLRIVWRDVDAEQTWIVAVEYASGGSDPIYALNDETGEYTPLTREQRVRYLTGKAIFDDEPPFDEVAFQNARQNNP